MQANCVRRIPMAAIILPGMTDSSDVDGWRCKRGDEKNPFSRGREPHMKLATLALASVLAMSSSMALAQGAGAVGAGGTTGETTAGGAIASSLGSFTSTGTTGMSNGS